MKMKSFKALDYAKQVAILFNHAAFLCKRENKSYKVHLFQLEGFYIEVYYKRSANKVSHLKTFATTSLLTPYLNKIDIAELLVGV